MAQVVLEGVGNPAVVEADVRRPLVLAHVVAHDLLEQEVELSEVAEHDVPAEIPGEAGRVDLGRGEAAGVIRALVDRPLAEAEEVELSCAREPARTGSDDCNSIESTAFAPRRRHGEDAT